MLQRFWVLFYSLNILINKILHNYQVCSIFIYSNSFYKRGGKMKGLLKNALKALKKHYSKILLINRKLDIYYPIVVEDNEKQWDTINKLTDFANWFIDNGNIYEADKPLFKQYVQDCFINGQNKYLFYRRRSGEEYRWAYIFIEKGDDIHKPEEEYLYVRDCNEIYIEQCDLILDSIGYVDPLTGFKNNLAFNTERNENDTINFVTVSNLGVINVECGYDAGNEMISRVANIIEDYTDNVYRVTGAKFALLNVKDIEKLKIELKGIANVE